MELVAQSSSNFEHVATPGALALVSLESGCLGMQSKVGGKIHVRLNTGMGLIVSKYLKGKLKRTLENTVQI